MKNKFENSLKDWKPHRKVPYKGREWNVKELLVHLAKKVEELTKNRCKPKVKCLFKYHEYMDKKHIKNKP